MHGEFCVQTRLYPCLCVCSRCVVYSLCNFGNVHLLCVSHRHIHSKYKYIYIYAELYNFSVCSCLSKSRCLYVVFFLSMRRAGQQCKVFTPCFISDSACNLAGFVLYSKFAFKRCCIFLCNFSLTSK